jgi:hypothetical protein
MGRGGYDGGDVYDVGSRSCERDERAYDPAKRARLLKLATAIAFEKPPDSFDSLHEESISLYRVLSDSGHNSSSGENPGRNAKGAESNGENSSIPLDAVSPNGEGRTSEDSSRKEDSLRAMLEYPSRTGVPLLWVNSKTGSLYEEIYAGQDVTLIIGPEYHESWYPDNCTVVSPADEVRRCAGGEVGVRVDNWSDCDIKRLVSCEGQAISCLESISRASWVSIVSDLNQNSHIIIKVDRTPEPKASTMLSELWSSLAAIGEHKIATEYRHNEYRRGHSRDKELWAVTIHLLKYLTRDVVTAELRRTMAGHGPPVDWITAMLVTQGPKHYNRAALAMAIAAGSTALGLIDAGLKLPRPHACWNDDDRQRMGSGSHSYSDDDVTSSVNAGSPSKDIVRWKPKLVNSRIAFGGGNAAVASCDASMAAPGIFPIEIFAIPFVTLVGVILLVVLRWHTGKAEEIIQASGVLIATFGLGLTALVLKVVRTGEDVSDIVRGIKKLTRQSDYDNFLGQRPLTTTFEDNFSTIPFSEFGSCALAGDNVRRTEAGTRSKNMITVAALARAPERDLVVGPRGCLTFCRCDGSHAEIQFKYGKLSTHATDIKQPRRGSMANSRSLKLAPIDGAENWYVNG